VRVSGDAVSVRLVGDAGSYAGGEVPAGRYAVMAVFQDGAPATQAGSATVAGGAALEVACSAAFQKCKVR
jgi:hypothetical protein